MPQVKRQRAAHGQLTTLTILRGGLRGLSMSGLPTREHERDFTKYWLIGLGWGILAAAGTTALILCSFTLFVAFSDATTRILQLPIVLIVALFYGAFVAMILALVPIGPMAALLAWPLYRRGVTNVWAYACAGSLSAVSAPALIVAMNILKDPTPPSQLLMAPGFLWSTLFIVTWFVAVGAFAGYMAARNLLRDIQRRAG
jgi:hypothetical protein